MMSVSGINKYLNAYLFISQSSYFNINKIIVWVDLTILVHFVTSKQCLIYAPM